MSYIANSCKIEILSNQTILTTKILKIVDIKEYIIISIAFRI